MFQKTRLKHRWIKHRSLQCMTHFEMLITPSNPIPLLRSFPRGSEQHPKSRGLKVSSKSGACRTFFDNSAGMPRRLQPLNFGMFKSSASMSRVQNYYHTYLEGKIGFQKPLQNEPISRATRQMNGPMQGRTKDMADHD